MLTAALYAVASVALVATVPPEPGLQAQDWPNWRGPNHDGSSAVEGLPLAFDPDRGVRWAAELPGPGASTPIVLGRRVFLTCVEPEGGVLLALCLDRESGEPLWDDVAGSGYRPGAEAGSATELHGRSNYASPSAASDGERVFFLFGNGDLVAYDLAGERSWARNLQRDLGDFAFQWTFSASPTVFAGKLFLPILQRDEPANGLGQEGAKSFLLALDPATGKTLLQVERPSDARMESRESYATAIPHVGADGRAELLVMGGDVLTGHDPEDGRELWRWGTWNPGHREAWWRVVPSPVVGDGVALACGPKGAPVSAVELGKVGTLGPEAVRWQSAGRRDPVTTDVPTPLFYRGAFFVLSDLRQSLSRVDPASGKVAWTTELPGRARWRASPLGADGKVWCLNHAGLVVAIDAKSGALVARNAMAGEDEDNIRSSLVAAHGSLFVRTNTALFCIGE